MQHPRYRLQQGRRLVNTGSYVVVLHIVTQGVAEPYIEGDWYVIILGTYGAAQY